MANDAGYPTLAAMRLSMLQTQMEVAQLRDTVGSMGSGPGAPGGPAIDALAEKITALGGIWLPSVEGFTRDGDNYACLVTAFNLSRSTGQPIVLPGHSVRATLPAATSLDVGGVKIVGADATKCELLLSWTTDFTPLLDNTQAGTSLRSIGIVLDPACAVKNAIMFKWRPGAHEFRIERCRLIGRCSLLNYSEIVDHCINDTTSGGYSEGFYFEDNIVRGFRFTFMQSVDSTHNKRRLRFINNDVREVFSSHLGINSPSAKLEDVVWQNNTLEIAEAAATSIHCFGIDVAGGDDIKILDNVLIGDFVDAIHIEESTYRCVIRGNSGEVTRNAISYMDGDAEKKDTFARSPRRTVISGNIFKKVSAKNGITGTYNGFNGIFDATNRAPIVDSIVTDNVMEGFTNGFYTHGVVSSNLAIVANNAQEGEQVADLQSPALLSRNTAINCGTGYRAYEPAGAIDGNRSVRCALGAAVRSGYIFNHTFEQCAAFFQKDGTGTAGVRNWRTITSPQHLTAAGVDFVLMTGAVDHYERTVDAVVRAQSKFGAGVYTGSQGGSSVVQPTAGFVRNDAGLTHSASTTAGSFKLKVMDSQASTDAYVIADVQGTAFF